MFCPKCRSKCLVLDSRPAKNNTIRRRYQCKRCQFRFTTYEALKNFNIPIEIYDILKKNFNDIEITRLSVGYIIQQYLLAQNYRISDVRIKNIIEMHKKLESWKRSLNVV